MMPFPVVLAYRLPSTSCRIIQFAIRKVLLIPPASEPCSRCSPLMRRIEARGGAFASSRPFRSRPENPGESYKLD